MSRRIFVGLAISESLKARIAEFQQKYRDLSVRWMKPDGLHLTLIPPWHVSDLEKARGEFLALEEVFAPIGVDFFRFTFGPNPREPRLMWLEGKFSQQLWDLKQKVEQHYDFRFEKRRFIPHITVARFRLEKFASFAVKNLREPASIHESFAALCLFESVLKPGGAEYETIARIES